VSLSKSSISTTFSPIAAIRATSWRRLWREIRNVFLVLLLIEIILRLGPISNVVSNNLDVYESLLWYDPTMPAYEAQLKANPDYTVWLLGSSYLMSALDPHLMQDHLRERGLKNITVQNYGMNRLVNLQVMSQVIDRWLFHLDQPKYIVLGISERNFTVGGGTSHIITNSPYENMFVLPPDSADDVISGFLYRNSALFRYSILMRNAAFVPRKVAIVANLERGGYVERYKPLDCTRRESLMLNPNLGDDWFVRDIEGGLSRLDHLLNVIQKRDIPLIVVGIPEPVCAMQFYGFEDYQDYTKRYLEPVKAHLQQRNIPFFILDTRFHEEIAPTDQTYYYIDGSHPNSYGAELFSDWTAKYVAEWLESHQQKPVE
jgi:hypothetical protein